MGLKLEVIFAERGTYGSREQCTGPTQGNADTDALLSKSTLSKQKVETIHSRTIVSKLLVFFFNNCF